MDETEIKTVPETELGTPEAGPETGSAPQPDAYETALPDAASEPDEPDGTDDPAPETDPAQEADPAQDESFRRQAEEDLARLRLLDPETAAYRHLGEMPGAIRFAELRELGLSVEEAYYAVRGANPEKPSPDRGGRAHLHASVPGRAASGGAGMTVGEIEAARRLFPGLPDREIASLYRRVNENG